MSSGHVDTTIKTAVLANTVFDAVLDATAINAWYTEVAAKIDGNYDEAHADNVAAIGLYRQAIINGNFDVWQRGTTLSNGGYLADRWLFNVAGGGTMIQSRQAFTAGQTDVPNEPTYFYRVAITVAFTGSNLTQSIEDVRVLAGGAATISFWAKADATKTLTVEMVQGFGTGGSSSVYVSGGQANLTTTWQKFTFTMALSSITGKTIGAGSGVSLVFTTGTQTGIFDIAQIQVNAGDTALPFQPKNFANELALCQRYYEKSYGIDIPPATTTSAGFEVKNVPSSTIANLQVYGNTRFKVKKRIVPTITIYPKTTPTNTGRVSDNSNFADLGAGSGSSVYAGDDGFTTYNNSGGSLTITGNAVVYHWAADAEL